jgi:transcriptional regulator with XRE-family HTH domain
MTFGELVRTNRRRLNKSLQDVANALNISVVYVSEVERGKRPPFTNERLPVLADVLEIDLNELTKSAFLGRKMIELDPATTTDQTMDAMVALARGGLSDNQLKSILEILGQKQMEIF